MKDVVDAWEPPTSLNLEDLTPRPYQVTIARQAEKQNTLIVLPTGLGKTFIASMVLARWWDEGHRCIVVLAPTKPLVLQQVEAIRSHLRGDAAAAVQGLTGQMPPQQRAGHYGQPAILVATPQVIQNDLQQGLLRADQVKAIVFDEAHRATGDHAYALIAKQFPRNALRTMALTASPGSDPKRVIELMQRLHLTHAEVRSATDTDVAPFVQQTDVEWETLPMPGNVVRASRKLDEALQARVRTLRSKGYLAGAPGRPSKTQLLELQRKLQERNKQNRGGPDLYQAMSLQAQCMKLLFAIECVETQGSEGFRQFVLDMRQEATQPKSSKATRVLAEDPKVEEAFECTTFEEHENPKLGRVEQLLRDLVQADASAKAILFANYRQTCEHLFEHLRKVDGLAPMMFVGQGTRKGRQGQTQKQQSEILQQFRDGAYNVLVATSVAEEGLDIPATDLVLFYEPIASEIRTIQRRGRTGRSTRGRVVVLMTKGSQDEISYYQSKRKEEEMVRQLHLLRQSLSGPSSPVTRAPVTTASLQAFDQATPTPSPTPAPAALKDVKVLIDHREAPSGLIQSISSVVDVRPTQLEVGDFVVSDRMVIERKTASDLVASILDGRFFDQLKAMQVYPKPILLLEGPLDRHGRNVKDEAIWGALASASLDYGMQVVQTADPEETAKFVIALAKREQRSQGRKLAARQAPPTPERGPVEMLCSVPGIQSATALKLLDRFQTIEGLVQATQEQLRDVEGIGERTADYLYRFFRRRTPTV